MSKCCSVRNAGEPPDTLLSYFPKKKDGSPGFLTIIDESHVALPQLGGMSGMSGWVPGYFTWPVKKSYSSRVCPA